jgi:hypothetical protein
MMFEIVSTIGLTVSASLIVASLAHAMAQTVRGRVGVGSGFGVWFALVLVIGAGGALDPEHGFGVPALGATVALPVVALISAFFFFGPIRTAMQATPLPALIAVNAIRVVPGLLFMILYAVSELPAPFAPSAGEGDLFIGVAALPLAWSIIRFGPRVRVLALLWNTFGVVDLVNAIALGALSAPGSLQTFVGPPTSAIMTTLPWLIVPGFLVPSLIFVHVVIFYRLLVTSEIATIRPPALSGAATKAP